MEQRSSAAALMSATTGDSLPFPVTKWSSGGKKRSAYGGIYIFVTFAQSITFQNQLFSTLHDL